MSGPSSPPASFELIREVQPADIDKLGHVSNVVYLRWIQDAATGLLFGETAGRISGGAS